LNPRAVRERARKTYPPGLEILVPGQAEDGDFEIRDGLSVIAGKISRLSRFEPFEVEWIRLLREREAGDGGQEEEKSETEKQEAPIPRPGTGVSLSVL
jgi:hypothetical protein